MSNNSVPILDLPAQHRALLPELLERLKDHLERAAFIGGKAVEDFERDFARFTGAETCVGVANGTDALMLALRVFGVGPGDAVLVPAFTFIATAEAVNMLGAQVRFVDIDPKTYTMDPKALRHADAAHVKVVVPVHLYGQPADMDGIAAVAKARSWRVLEDSAQAHGAQYRGKPVGSMGDLAAFSFYPGKNLGALGDGGAVTGKKGEVVERLRRLANHGRISKYEHGEWGVNSRLDAIQAMALGIKLKHLADWNGQRNKIAALYDERLGSLKDVVIPARAEGCTHVYHLYVLQAPDRDRLVQSLKDNNIESGVHYPIPLHLQPAYRHLGYGRGDFPVSEALASRCLSLPIFPEMTEAQVERVVAVVRAHLKAGA